VKIDHHHTSGPLLIAMFDWSCIIDPSEGVEGGDAAFRGSSFGADMLWKAPDETSAVKHRMRIES
jgi:hypothetical protein